MQTVYNMWVLPDNHLATVSLVTEILKMLAIFVFLELCMCVMACICTVVGDMVLC